MNELISIIVPMYNMQEYISKCLDSIIKQTYSNIEILVINDGSTDESENICKKYMELDNRIVLINKENGGLSSARNKGLQMAKGKYIAFIDSDDYINEKYIETLYNLCIQHNASIAQCSFYKKSINEEVKISDEKDVIIQGAQQFIIDMKDKVENVVAWNKLYLKSLFEGINYPEGKIHEDEAVTYKLVYKAEKVAKTSEKLYFYIIRDNSIMNSKYSVDRLYLLEALEEKLKFFYEKKEKEIVDSVIVYYADKLFESYWNSKKYIKEAKDICKNIKKKYNKILTKLIFLKSISIVKKLKYLFAYLFFDIYVQTFYMKQKY